MANSSGFLQGNYVLKILLGIVLFIFYVHAFNSIANFYNIEPQDYANYMFFFAALVLFYFVLPSENRSFLE